MAKSKPKKKGRVESVTPAGALAWGTSRTTNPHRANAFARVVAARKFRSAAGRLVSFVSLGEAEKKKLRAKYTRCYRAADGDLRRASALFNR